MSSRCPSTIQEVSIAVTHSAIQHTMGPHAESSKATNALLVNDPASNSDQKAPRAGGIEPVTYAVHEHSEPLKEDVTHQGEVATQLADLGGIASGSQPARTANSPVGSDNKPETTTPNLNSPDVPAGTKRRGKKKGKPEKATKEPATAKKKKNPSGKEIRPVKTVAKTRSPSLKDPQPTKRPGQSAPVKAPPDQTTRHSDARRGKWRSTQSGHV